MLELNQIYQGNCKEFLPDIPSNSVDACVTDPPYNLGFMGKAWDKTGIAYDVDVWKEILRVLKPGGHLLSFGGSRTYHRMACAIEDAGFEIRGMCEWIFGSGFPKSLNIGKAVDRLQNNNRDIVGVKQHAIKNFKDNLYAQDPANKNNKKVFGYGEEEITVGNSEWEGWGTALKPAHEPLCFARKPLSEKTVAENVLKWGTGGINIDGCRISSERQVGWGGDGSKMYDGGLSRDGGEARPVTGRFPADLIHDGSEEVLGLFPTTTSAKGQCKYVGTANNNWIERGGIAREGHQVLWEGKGDSGSAARFFYCAKASKSERGEGNTHPTVKPISLIKYLITLVSREGQIIIDPFSGSGTTAIACINAKRNYICIEKDFDYWLQSTERVERHLEVLRKGTHK